MSFSFLANVTAQNKSAQQLDARPINWFVQNYAYEDHKKMLVKNTESHEIEDMFLDDE